MRDNWSMSPQPGTTMTMRNVPLLVLIAAGIAILVLLILLVRRYLQQRRERLQREQAERANAAKSQFLATASHELRTPMQAILGLLELEQEQHPSPRLELMHSSARSLMALLNDLQDHARIESHSFRLSPRPIDLAHWLQQQQQFYHPLMRDAGPQLVVEALTTLPAAVLLDGDRLQQVVNNLVANALKFTRAGDIRLTLAVSNDIVLMVADCGSGIPLAEQAQLFEPWYQAPSGKTHAVQGSGLGLFICREIVQRMGGTLTLTSAPGVGTTVQVTLPLQLADGEPAATVSSWPHYPQLRVAIVDDHPTNLLVMQQQLATFAIHAEVFDDGRALLRADARQPFDVLFIDQMMPRPDGFTLLRILRRRQRQRGSAALRILCSADAQLAKQPLQPDEALLIKPITLAAIAPLLARTTHDPLRHLPDSLRILAQHNESFIPRICQTLQRTLMQDRDALLAAHEGQNWPELARAAHRMKGSWLLLGIDDIATHCQQLTDAAKQQRLEPESFDLLISLTNRLLKQLESYGTHPFSQRA